MRVTGKSYELVSFKSQEADATVFLPTASEESKIGNEFFLLLRSFFVITNGFGNYH